MIVKSCFLILVFVIFASVSGIISFQIGVIDSEVIHKGILVGIASMVGVFIGIKIIEKCIFQLIEKFYFAYMPYQYLEPPTLCLIS